MSNYYVNAEGGPQPGDVFLDNLDRYVVITDEGYHFLWRQHSDFKGESGYNKFAPMSSPGELTGTYPDHSVDTTFKKQLPRLLLVRDGKVVSQELIEQPITFRSHVYGPQVPTA